MWFPAVAFVKKSAALNLEPALIDGVGQGIDCYLGDRIQSKHKVGRETAVQIRQRIVGLQTVDDVAVGKRRQTIELHVAITVRPAHEVVSAARCVDESARGELQRVRHVAARVREVFNGAGVQRCRGIRILRVDQWRLLLHNDAFNCGCDVQREIDRLLPPKSCGHRVALLSLEAPHFDFYRI
jgi:hypothetical protein